MKIPSPDRGVKIVFPLPSCSVTISPTSSFTPPWLSTLTMKGYIKDSKIK